MAIVFSHMHSSPVAKSVEQEDATRDVVTPDGLLHSDRLRASEL